MDFKLNLLFVNRDRPSTSEAHQFFMNNYPKMFNRPATHNIQLSLDSRQLRYEFYFALVIPGQQSEMKMAVRSVASSSAALC